MKDFSNFTKDWWQIIFKTEECFDTCRPLGSSSWDYFLKQANIQCHQTDEVMIEQYGHTKRCGICDIPMSDYESIKKSLGEEIDANWKREVEMQNQEIMILCIYCLELMEVKEKGMTKGTTIKLVQMGSKVIDIIKEHPSTHPEYFRELRNRPTCVH